MSNVGTPMKASHRFLKELLTSSQGVSPTPEEFDRVSRVFVKAGGSWVRVFEGSVKDVGLLKQLLKVAVKSGYLTKTVTWGG